ncbi:RHS repeat-associated core domain-containing protein [Catenulispora subtropica]|uniref:RHS repeat-associated core domain-containing protein n=1 Tax=Catenulispora subtropica TaxID=450798 RepID=A0ABN2SQZ6_9ACTN
MLTAAALAAVLGQQTGAQAAPGGGWRPQPPPDHRIPSTPFVPQRAPVVRGGLPGGGAVPAPVWPAAATADLTVGAPDSATARTAGPDQPAKTPLTLRAATGSAAGRPARPAPAGGTTVHVRVLDHAAAARAGVTGVLLAMTPATAAPVDATVDYSAFRTAAGADFGSRLTLVRLPECALTTPDRPECRTQTPVPGTANDTGRHTLTASLPLTASTTLLAATTQASGPGGSFTATSLSPTGTWAAGGSTGGFTWTYPVAVPAVAGGVAPQVALSYSSNVVDGRTGTTNNQSSWIGEGWDYSPGFVERTYRTCSSLTDLPVASQTGDQCWAGQILTMSLGGRSTVLVYDDGTHTLHEQNESGDRVELLTGASNGARDGEYFKVTTPDGTQYFFGRNGGPGAGAQNATNSTWTVPVYGAHSGDPCYSSSGFGSSSCTQGWRWNLDYVEDVHGNAMLYTYTPETNYYGANGATTGTAYTRGGTLTRIDYGLRVSGGSVYGDPAAGQIVFTVAERCTPDASFTCDPAQMAANPTKWPDVPVDQLCAAGATCSTHAPTFWSTKRLANITTQYRNAAGASVKVDSYDLAQAFPSDADPELWLSGVSRTGYDAAGTALAAPLPTTFYGQAMVNRVPNVNGLSGMPHWRLTSVSTDMGGVVNVYYNTTCAQASFPQDPSQNTSMCMPTYWSPPHYSDPILDYFAKYVVSEVDEQDPNGLTPVKKTFYTYTGDPAWHYDDNEVVKPENRTWGQFRGYGEVHIKTGNPSNGEQLTDTATKFLRGMDGDTLPGNGKRSVSVTNSLNETLTDDNALAGSEYEKTQYNGDGGARLSRTLTTPSVLATTATRARSGLPALTATVVRPVKARTIADLAAGGVRTATRVSGYDAVGRVISVDDSGDGVPELCTTTAYADNTTTWVRNRVSETVTAQQACPAPGTALGTALSDSRTYFDGSSTLGALPGAGDPTRADQLNNGAFFTSATTTYDALGRVLTVADALGRTTSTAYTPAGGGVLTQKVVTNPLGQKTTTVLNPGRGTTASVTDIAGHVSSATYDPLGRTTQVWQPGRTQGQATPNLTFTYAIQAKSPQAVITNQLVDYGTGTNYVTSAQLYDGLGRTVQTQKAAAGGGSQVSDTFYDGHGWTVDSYDHYLIQDVPSTTRRQVQPSAVDSRTVTGHDGSGRVTATTTYRGNVKVKSGSTVYGGDRVTVFAPTGGTTQTVVTDVRGHTQELDQYTSQPTVSGTVVSGGVAQATKYTNDAFGRPLSMTSGGGTWTFTLDTLGHQIANTTPDAGRTSTVYDNAGQVLSTTDARGQTLAYTYDAVGRRTAEYAGSTSGTKLASWLYDTLQAGKETNETRYTAQGNYVTGVSSYDGQGNALGQVTSIPTTETGLGKNYLTRYTYSSTGLNLTVTPAVVSGMPGETVTNSYDNLGNPIGVRGTSVVATQALFGYGNPSQITYGGATNNAYLGLTYDQQSLRVVEAALSAQLPVPQLDDTKYGFDDYGHLTSVVDTRGPAGSSPVDAQCFGYDALERLGQAWTSAAADCTKDPAVQGNAVVGGPDAYWTTWTFDGAGDRASQTSHLLPGATGSDRTTAYTYNTTNGGHTLTSTSGDAAGPTSYTYDKAGNTLTRVLPSGQQTLDWNEEGKPVKATTPTGITSWVYTASGSELLRRDPASVTLYLPGQEVTRDTATGTLTTKRYYQLGATLVAVSDGTAAGTDYLTGDQHGTQQLAVNTTTLALTRRSLDPYGNQRGTVSGGAWPDNHGFLNKAVSTGTGLVDVGAREYDPTTGRFISADPKLDSNDPQSMTGYAYADNRPTADSDPSGLMLAPVGDGSDWSDSADSSMRDSWWDDPGSNPQVIPTWHDTSGSGNNFPGDRWMDEDRPRHYCDGCEELPRRVLSGDEQDKVQPPDDTSGNKDLVSRLTVVLSEGAETDTTTVWGMFMNNTNTPYSEGVATSESLSHTFAKMMGAGFNADGKIFKVSVNGNLQWSDTDSSTTTKSLTVNVEPTKPDEYIGFSPAGWRTNYRTYYTYKDGTTTSKDWTTFDIRGVTKNYYKLSYKPASWDTALQIIPPDPSAPAVGGGDPATTIVPGL